MISIMEHHVSDQIACTFMNANHNNYEIDTEHLSDAANDSAQVIHLLSAAANEE
jgi:hypothetical protein